MTTLSAPPRKDERLTSTGWLTRTLRRPALGSLVGAIVVFVLFAITDSTSKHLWLSSTGVAAWTQQAAFFGIMAVPVGMLMIGGEFDLSTGGMTGFTAIITALLVGQLGWNAWAAITVTVLFGALIGFVNGYVVTRSKLPSFIVTLATYFALRGVSIGGVLLVNHGSTEISVGPRHAPRSGERQGDLRQLARSRALACPTVSRPRSCGSSRSPSSPCGCSAGPRSATGCSRSAAISMPRATSAFR